MGVTYKSRYTGPEIDAALDKFRNAYESVVSANFADFPPVGRANTLYLATDQSMLYFWDDETQSYKTLIADAPETDFSIIDGGGANTWQEQ